MFTTTFQDTGMSRGIAGLIEATGLAARTVLEKETMELHKELVRITPPSDASGTRKNIQRDITGKFNLVSDESLSNMDRYSGTVGASGIKWYKADSQFLRGIAPKADKREASVEELEVLRHTITRKGRLSLPFRHPHKRQRVLLYQTIVTKRSTVNKLIRRAQSHVGRLKASWLTAVAAGVVRFTGSRVPPQWVLKHINSNLRGTFINGLQSPKNPTFTITNFARGIGQKSVPRLIQYAVETRAKSMAGNALLFMQGKKRVGDYAK
jgi:hypothetical protein